MKRPFSIRIQRRQQYLRIVAMFLAMNMFFNYIAPVAAFALTSGPGQPEFASFEPVGTSDMVDLFSGDFNYNIPLLSVPGPNGGYPVNLAYHAGTGMDEEASWTGLGWNVNVGAINRSLRGLPDDFKGDQVIHRSNLKTNWTVGMDLQGAKKEFFGIPQSTSTFSQWSQPQWQIYYNNYRGLGYRVSTTYSKTEQSALGLELSYDSQGGIGFEPDFTISNEHTLLNHDLRLGAGYNSRQGLTGGSFTTIRSDKNWSSSSSFGARFDVPSVSMPMRSTTFPFSLHAGVGGSVVNAHGKFNTQYPQTLTGFYSESRVADNGTTTSAAYGYLHTEDASDPEHMRDFQREEIPYSKRVPNLAPSSFTYDLYSQSGQGSGSQFRPYSNATGILSDREQTNKNYAFPLNIEYGSGIGTHLGVGFQIGVGSNVNGPWQDVGANSDIDFLNTLNFAGTQKPEYEAAPFKVFGEKSGVLDSEDHLKNWGSDKPVRVEVDKESDATWLMRQFVARNNFQDKLGNSVFQAGNSQKYRNTDRTRRATNTETLDETKAQLYGFTKNIGYTVSGGAHINTAKSYFGGTRAAHISEMTTVQPDGMRYTYGLPAYNNVQYDGSFAIPASNANFNSKTVAIPHGSGSWQPTTSGTLDDFSQQTELPAYVHAWLLTSVVSADYIDLTNNGPTDDDYGYWVRFNYEKKSSNYNWHVPYAGANFFEGKKGDPTDNRASYSCGNREEYLLASIETRTHIAVFITSVREDGVAAENDLGGGFPASLSTNNRLYKLDEIKLYAKTEYYTDVDNRILNGTAVPIKTAHFRYTYELCGKPQSTHPDYTYYSQFVTNNTGNPVDENGNTVSSSSTSNVNYNKGKLTLRKVWFTYQNNERGEFSPYVFDYSLTQVTGFNIAQAGTDDNPFYDPSAADRWGNFKDLSPFIGTSNQYPYVDIPYTDQKTAQSANTTQVPVSGAWCLKRMTLPSGAKVQVEYEPDDYGYVEDQKAMRMFDIVALGETEPPSGGNINDIHTGTTTLTTPIQAETGSEILHGAYRVYFRLEKAEVPSGLSTATLRESYIKSKYLDNGTIDKIYFKTFMDLKNSGNGSEEDYVSGYAELDYGAGNIISTGVLAVGMVASGANGSDYDLGFITLKGVPIGTATVFNTQIPLPPIPKISPFIHAALQHLHFNRSELVHQLVPYSNSIPAQIGNLMNSFSNASTDILQAMTGFNTWAYGKGYGKKMHLNGRSFIRLHEPDLKKSGGGYRVKSVSVNDNWVNTGSGDNYEYGMTYDYTINEPGYENPISSGVCYEPRIGSEESALRQPIEYVNSTPLHSDENLFLEKPLFESYYPSPSVGYRKVTVKSTAPAKATADDAGNTLKYNAAPVSIYQFYTAKEFPVIFDQTDMSADPSIVRPLLIPGIFTSFTKRKARSQGYVLILNDMHGKMRSVEQRTLPSGTNLLGTLISKEEYIYNTEQPFNDQVANRLSSKVQVITEDGKYQTASIGQSHDIVLDMNEKRETNFSGGLEFNLDVSAGGVPVPTAFPQISKRDLSMRTAVLSKIINRTGIIKDVIATHQSSTIKTQNVAFDLETGEPILTKTFNEFKDPVYSYSYPGHWYYDAMKGGYKNYGVFVDLTTITPGYLISSSAGRVSGISGGYLTSGKTAADYFKIGDEVEVKYVSPSSGWDRCHVIKTGSNFIDLVRNSTGEHIASGLYIGSIRVIRSAHDNMQSASVGSLAMRAVSGIQAYDPATMSPTTTPTSFTIPATDNILGASAVEFTNIMQKYCFFDCEPGNTVLNDEVDPFRIGLRGVWRPYRSYGFVVNRNQTNNIRTDGTYTAFTPFTWADPSLADVRWVSAATITKYAPDGFELENKNATGNYSAALYGYRRSLNTAVASNAQYKEITFDGFEDYYANLPNCEAVNNHWSFNRANNLSATYAHTGQKSLKVANNTNYVITNKVGTDNCEATNAALRLPQTGGSPTDPSAEYLVSDCDCIDKFKPTPGKKYMLSVWVKQAAVGSSGYVPNAVSAYTSPGISINVRDGSGTAITMTVTAETPVSPVIEGWQRQLYTFTIPSAAASIDVVFANDNTTASDDYFDDIRITPFDANMTSYVYDPVNYRLVAQLDANNFATFYIYNSQGMLEKVKVETTDGIKTIKEGRNNTDKH